MKNLKTLCVILFCVISTNNFAQGIAIQGIARDANNTAKINQNITLDFEVYYINSSSESEQIFAIQETLLTDAFGVFSYVLEIPNALESQFSNNDQYLKITEGNTIISNEIFKRVPYAISANNGVPTGSIMPYLGTTAPSGWLLCDGNSIPVNENTLALRSLLGTTNTPNLKGMFLRGTGTSSVNNQAGPSLMQTQGDQNKSHNHGKGSLSTTSNGNHSHGYVDTVRQHSGSNHYVSGGGYSFAGGEDNRNKTTNSGGNHNHAINGSTSNSGGNETRPVNYGVNYIIKL